MPEAIDGDCFDYTSDQVKTRFIGAVGSFFPLSGNDGPVPPVYLVVMASRSPLVMAVELTKANKVKRIYNQVLDNFSSASIGQIFTKHIDRQKAKVLTDQWKAYSKLAKQMNYTIERVNSKQNSSSKFFEIHTMVHQVKTTL